MAVGPDMGVARFAAAKFALEKVPDLRPVMRRYDTLSIGAALIVASISFLVSAAAVATGMNPAAASVVVAVLVTATAAGALLSLMAWLQSELQRVLTPAYNAFVEWGLELQKTGVRGVAGEVTASTWLEFLLGRIEGSTKWLEILIAAAGLIPAAAVSGAGTALAGGPTALAVAATAVSVGLASIAVARVAARRRLLLFLAELILGQTVSEPKDIASIYWTVLRRRTRRSPR